MDCEAFAVCWPPWAFRLFGSAPLRFYWYCFLFRPRQGGSRPHISEGSDFSDFSSACRCAASRAARNLKREDPILRSKMPFTWVGPPRPDPAVGRALRVACSTCRRARAPAGIAGPGKAPPAAASRWTAKPAPGSAGGGEWGPCDPPRGPSPPSLSGASGSPDVPPGLRVINRGTRSVPHGAPRHLHRLGRT